MAQSFVDEPPYVPFRWPVPGRPPTSNASENQTTDPAESNTKTEEEKKHEKEASKAQAEVVPTEIVIEELRKRDWERPLPDGFWLPAFDGHDVRVDQQFRGSERAIAITSKINGAKWTAVIPAELAESLLASLRERAGSRAKGAKESTSELVAAGGESRSVSSRSQMPDPGDLAYGLATWDPIESLGETIAQGIEWVSEHVAEPFAQRAGVIAGTPEHVVVDGLLYPPRAVAGPGASYGLPFRGLGPVLEDMGYPTHPESGRVKAVTTPSERGQLASALTRKAAHGLAAFPRLMHTPTPTNITKRTFRAAKGAWNVLAQEGPTGLLPEPRAGLPAEQVVALEELETVWGGESNPYSGAVVDAGLLGVEMASGLLAGEAAIASIPAGKLPRGGEPLRPTAQVDDLGAGALERAQLSPRERSIRAAHSGHDLSSQRIGGYIINGTQGKHGDAYRFTISNFGAAERGASPVTLLTAMKQAAKDSGAKQLEVVGRQAHPSIVEFISNPKVQERYGLTVEIRPSAGGGAPNVLLTAPVD